MTINENELFKQVTLRICGTLDIEKGLFNTFLYLKKFIPLDGIALTYMATNPYRHTAIAWANKNGGLEVFDSVPLSKEIFERIANVPPIFKLDRAELGPLATGWINKGAVRKGDSLIVFRLYLEKQLVGAVTLIADGSNRYTEEHLELLKPLEEPFAISISNAKRFIELNRLKQHVVEDNQFLKQELLNMNSQQIIGENHGLAETMELVRKVAKLNSPVLLLGESGTGKEMLAKAIHNLSSRRENPFVACNCGAIPETLVDSELFGHEKGSFTGATAQKKGRFERASSGTVFLDEIGELKPDAQVRFLRVLQEKQIERVGGDSPIDVDIRVVAATHRDLDSMIKDGDFREDLFFRLQVFPIRIPPLRERTQDIPQLLEYFIAKKAAEMGIENPQAPDKDTVKKLQNYPWPGNVRELENAVERELIINKNGPMAFAAILGEEADIYSSLYDDYPSDEFPSLDKVQTIHISHALILCGGKVGGKDGAAALLDINPSTLRKRMRKLGIDFGRGVSE